MQCRLPTVSLTDNRILSSTLTTAPTFHGMSSYFMLCPVSNSGTANGVPQGPLWNDIINIWPMVSIAAYTMVQPHTLSRHTFCPPNFHVWKSHAGHADNGYSRQWSVAISHAVPLGTGQFFGWGSKNWWKTIQTIKFKILLYAIFIFRKKCTGMQYTMKCGPKPQKLGEFSRIFVLKVTLQSVRLLLIVSYRRNCEAWCTTCSPNNFAGGTTAFPAAPVPTPMLSIAKMSEQVKTTIGYLSNS